MNPVLRACLKEMSGDSADLPLQMDSLPRKQQTTRSQCSMARRWWEYCGGRESAGAGARGQAMVKAGVPGRLYLGQLPGFRRVPPASPVMGSQSQTVGYTLGPSQTDQKE